MLERSEIGQSLLHIVSSSFLYIRITFAVLKVERKALVEKGILAAKDIGSLSFVLISIRNLRGMLDSLIDLLVLAWLFHRELPQRFLVLQGRNICLGCLDI